MKNNTSKNNPFANRAKSKSKPKVVAKKRGYYYSSANINKRKEFQKNLNQENNMNIEDNQNNEDFFPKKKNANFNFNDINDNNTNNRNNNYYNSSRNCNNNNINILELYNKNNLLLNYIESERKKLSGLLNKLKLINYSIGNIILKPKIKNFEVNKKLIREKEKKEQEEINFNKNISDKIDEALNKANMALDNIRYLGKPKNSKPPMINNNFNNNDNNNNKNINTKYNYNEFKKEKEKKNLISLAQKCLDKYVDNIKINNSNHDEYFITISKQRKLFKDAKEQLQSARYRLRNSSSFFDEIFKNNLSKANNNKESPQIVQLSKEIFYKENIFIRVNSFLKSEIFQKLFVKVLYNENFIDCPNIIINSTNSLTNNDVYNIFSLWIIIKEINTMLNQVDNNNLGLSFIDKNIYEEIMFEDKDNNIGFNSSNNYFLKNSIFDVIEKYLLFLNRKNNNSVNFDENQIFTQDYHKLYEIYFKLEQSKISQFIQNNIENNANFMKQNIMTNTKEELNYFRNIQSIFTNKGKYICSIINK